VFEGELFMKIYAALLSALLIGCTPLATVDQNPPSPLPQTPVIEALLQQGLQQKQSGNLVGAQAAFERAVRIEPNNAVSWFELAKIAYAQERDSEAKSLAQRAASLAGNNTELKNQIDQLLLQIN
jgi:Tfp pilus assembly protein PilF